MRVEDRLSKNIQKNKKGVAFIGDSFVYGSGIDIQNAGSGTITVASDEIFTLTRSGSSGNVTVKKGDVTVATFTNTNVASPLRTFYWCREQSASNSLPVVKEIKVRGAI